MVLWLATDLCLPAGIVLDAVGCCLPGELAGVSLLVHTLLKAGDGSIQIILAGEGSVTVARSSECAFLDLLPSSR